MLSAKSPRQVPMLQYIPARIPAASATTPVIHGMRIAPLLATGSMIPMLATLVIFPAQDTAVGFHPPMEAETAKSSTMASHWLSACTSPK